MVHRVLEFVAFDRNGRKTDEATAIQSLKVFSFDDVQEIKLINAHLVLLKAASVFSRVAQHGSLSILEELASFGVLLETLRTHLKELRVLRRALRFALFSREHPSPGGTCVKDNLHFLRRRAKVKLALVAHVLVVFHVDVD